MTRAELEEQRRFLLDSLRDLEREREAGEIAEDDYESLRDDYTARAAEVLRRLEAYEDVPEPAPEPGRRAGPSRPLRPSARPSRSRRATAIILIAGFAVVALSSVFALSASRGPSGPGTGSSADTPAQKLALAHQLESQGQAVEALKQYDAVLKDDPNNVEALTYRGWLLKLAGLIDPAQATIEKAISLDPSYPDAHFFRGMLLYQDRHDPGAAIPEFERYLASNPPEATVDAVQRVLDQARQAAVQPAPTTSAP